MICLRTFSAVLVHACILLLDLDICFFRLKRVYGSFQQGNVILFFLNVGTLFSLSQVSIFISRPLQIIKIENERSSGGTGGGRYPQPIIRIRDTDGVSKSDGEERRTGVSVQLRHNRRYLGLNLNLNRSGTVP